MDGVARRERRPTVWASLADGARPEEGQQFEKSPERAGEKIKGFGVQLPHFEIPNKMNIEVFECLVELNDEALESNRANMIMISLAVLRHCRPHKQNLTDQICEKDTCFP